MERHGVQIIAYDNNGDLFFLILRRVEGWKGWEFPKTLIQNDESEDAAVERLMKDQVGISKHKFVKKLNSTQAFQDGQDTHVFQFHLVTASMNIPVKNYANTKKHDNYLWAMLDSVQNKLTWAPEKEALKEAIDEIKKVEEL
ncbi:TPA: NUDIX domain-containing protein [Candidatus Woesearchaeota archaeon]|nr:NUDIX domain-containing protein [Candidatus Woesearchaeota archaeon]